MQEVLYRFFDSQGTLLYVGISNQWVGRISHHSKHADFYSAVAGMTLERYPDRDTLIAAELEAIKTENPLFNRKDNPDYKTWQTHFRELLDMATRKRAIDNVHEKLFENLRRGSGDEEYFGTGLWLSEQFPPEWYELWTRYGYDCELCEAVATHPTTHAWANIRGEE